MKRLLLAGSLVLILALSRAGARAGQNDAYGSLLGMADSASSDKGPQAGEIPRHHASAEERGGPGHPSGFAESAGRGSARTGNPSKIAPPAGAKREAAKDDSAAPSVFVPAAAPRAWTRLFSSLLPSMRRVSSFETAVSTAAPRAFPKPARPATPASVAGSAQGLLEFVSVATAPAAL